MDPSITSGVITGVVTLIIGLWIRKGQDSQREALDIRFKAIETKIMGYCSQNNKEHDDLWRHLNAHGHRGLKGEDNDVISGI